MKFWFTVFSSQKAYGKCLRRDQVIGDREPGACRRNGCACADQCTIGSDLIETPTTNPRRSSLDWTIKQPSSRLQTPCGSRSIGWYPHRLTTKLLHFHHSLCGYPGKPAGALVLILLIIMADYLRKMSAKVTTPGSWPCMDDSCDSGPPPYSERTETHNAAPTSRPRDDSHTPPMIAVMGPTGTGKTTLISKLADRDMRIGHDLSSCMLQSLPDKAIL